MHCELCREWTNPNFQTDLREVFWKYFIGSKLLKLDLDQSKLFWKGIEIWGGRNHEGEVRISQGFVLSDKTEFIGGKFEVDMKSISISDIPKIHRIPIKNLTEHLMHADFFLCG